MRRKLETSTELFPQTLTKVCLLAVVSTSEIVILPLSTKSRLKYLK